MQCPLCPTRLKKGVDGLIKCARFHRFRLHMEGNGNRGLELVVDPKNGEESQVGDYFPVVDNSETFAGG